MWSVKSPSANAPSFATRAQHYILLYLLSYVYAINAYAHVGFTLPSQASTAGDTNLFATPSAKVPSSGSSLEAASYRPTPNYDSNSLDTVRTSLARRVHQWRAVWEDPQMSEARDSVDAELRHEFEYLLYRDPLTHYALRLHHDPLTNDALRVVAAANEDEGSFKAGVTLTQEMADKLNEMEKKLDRIGKEAKVITVLERQDCGMDKLNSTSWRNSKVSDTLKAELDAWKRRNTGETFYQYMYEEYAPGLALSQTHCNGRGSCGVVSCMFVDRELPHERRQHMFYIMEMIARISRVTNEENDIIKHTLHGVADGTVDLVGTYTPMIQHDRARDAQKAADARQAAKANMINLVLGSIIPMFCCFTPGASMIASIASSTIGQAIVGATGGKISKETIEGRGPGLIGNGIGTVVAGIQGAVANSLRKETAMSAGSHPIQEIMITLGDYQSKMKVQIEQVQSSILDRAEALLNGTGNAEYNMHSITKDGAFLDTNIEKSAYLEKVKVEVGARALATMINHAWRSNYVYIVMIASANCETDEWGRKEIRACLPEVENRSFWFLRMDDAWNDRGKDVVTTPNGWASLPANLNITLENIARASYAWHKTYRYQDFDQINTADKLNALQEIGGPLYGTFNIPITQGIDNLSEIGDPVRMSDTREDEEYRPPCIPGGRSWWDSQSDDEYSDAYGFIKATGLYTHPSWHSRCQKGRARCKVDKDYIVRFPQSSNSRYHLPWGKCDKKEEHMKGNKHHWCEGSEGTVNMRLFTHCDIDFKTNTRDHPSQFEDIPQ